MGGSVAMKVAELDGSRLDGVVLVDVAGRVDPGVGPVIASVIEHLDDVHPSIDDHLAPAKALGLYDPWSDRWERFHRYGLEKVDGGVRSVRTARRWARIGDTPSRKIRTTGGST